MNIDTDTVVNGVITNIIAATLIALFPLIFYFRQAFQLTDYLLISLFALVLGVLLVHKYKFKTISGIINVNSSLEKGISPEKSLSLCKNNIRFLGIAANKLINCSEFEDAIKRCNRAGESIKFLLSSPDNPILRHMAGRANKEENEFKHMIIATLRRLQAMKEKNGYNMEVRLYESDGDSGPPSFRLLFIDNESALVSYYVMGDGNGLQVPQLQIKKPNGGSDVKNFYFPFDHYFNSLWESSEKLDIDKYRQP